jgi:S1-C subfamily serine protease
MLLGACSGHGGDLSPEQCAALLQKATVTVRVRLHPEVAKESEAGEGEAKDPSTQVTVCSGVAVGEKMVVTAAFAAADSQIRLTLPGGEQTDASLRVLDEFSGLALLESKDAEFEPLEFAQGAPAAGSWLMTAAAWGAEQPLVSIGIVGGVDRAIKGFVYPPLLQCDVRPADTSSGAGIIDRQGKLLGVIVAADSPDVHRGWLYAVPSSHVQRLLRTKSETSQEGSVVVLKRRRPHLGATFDSSSEAGVIVSRVVPGSPAEKAGVQKGDRVIAAEGKNVRFVYDAVRPTLYKQPGDVMTFTVQRGDEEKKIELVLGGGVELPSASLSVLGQLVAPKIDIGLKGKRGASGQVQPDVTISEVYSQTQSRSPSEKEAAAVDKLRMLEKANERYRLVIDQQQRELARREQEHRRQTEMLEALKAELEAARKAKMPR